MVEVSKRAIRWADDSDPVGALAIRLAARASAVEEECGEWTWRDIADLVVADTKTETAMLRSQDDDRRAVVRYVMRSGLPFLRSSVLCATGDEYELAFDGMVRDGLMIAEFPEAKNGCSGRQHWRLVLTGSKS